MNIHFAIQQDDGCSFSKDWGKCFIPHVNIHRIGGAMVVGDESGAIWAHVVSGTSISNSNDHVVDGGGWDGGLNAIGEEETEGFWEF